MLGHWPIPRRVLLTLLAIPLVAAGCSGGWGRPSRRPLPPPWYPAFNEQGDPVLAVFEGRTPCPPSAIQEGGPDCEKLKTALALYQGRRTSGPTTYLLARVIRGRKVVLSGRWSVERGLDECTAAQVYVLDTNAPADMRRYWRVSPHVLLFLDESGNVRAGNASWGFMLSRTGLSRTDPGS